MKNRVEPLVPLVDFRAVKQNVERRILRRRSRSTPSTAASNEMEKQLANSESTAGSTISSRTNKTSGDREKKKSFTDQVIDVMEKGTDQNKRHSGNNKMNQGLRKISSHLTNEEATSVDGRKKSSQVITRVFNSTRKAASKWKDFASTRRVHEKCLKRFEVLNFKKLLECDHKRSNTLMKDTCGFLEEGSDAYDGSKQSVDDDTELNIDDSVKNLHAKSKQLIRYFIGLSKAKEENKDVDLDFVETLINEGADPNWSDKYGQTVLHEVARIWHPDVAQFLIEHGSEVDKVDKFGRSPLHVAAAVDFSDMVEFLLSKGANIHLRTFDEEQTPIHYAAKNDACNSLATLITNGSSIEDRDFKDRTPLQLGAELDRSEACKVLLNEGAPAGVWDDSGMSCMSLMIQKMPPVALEALDQFHVKDRANRKQYFYLNYLEPPMSIPPTGAKSSLKVAVEEHQFAIVMHPVMQRITEVKWNWFGKVGACVHFSINLIFCIVWTTIICTLPNDLKELYLPLPEKAYRIVLEIFVICVLFYWMINEYLEYRNSIRERDDFIRWREGELMRDLKYCHPRWPEERAYVEREIAELADLKPSYLVDWWNYFDWLTYAFIIATIICHVTTIISKSLRSFDVEKAIGSVMLVLQWTRLMKFVRAFHPLGPFVVILRHVIWDTGRFAFLFFIFYIPYAASLWVLFGKRSVNGYSNFEELAYNLLQITVVGDFGFTDLATVDGRMARLLCGTYIVVSGIVCLNLFIALLSDTFQRVYDNVKANTQMLRAARVLNFEDNFSRKRRERIQSRLHHWCSPEITYYDDDMTDPSDTELKRMTQQIKQEVDNVKKYLHDKFGNAEEDVLESNHKNQLHREKGAEQDVKALREEVDRLKSNHEHSMKIVNMQLLSINSMLAEFVNKKKKRQSARKEMGGSRSGNMTQEQRPGNVAAVAPISLANNETQA